MSSPHRHRKGRRPAGRPLPEARHPAAGHRRRDHPSPLAGLSLLELLLALTLGLLLCGLVMRALALEGPQGAQLARLLRERSLRERTLELLRSDLLRADSVRLAASPAAACGLAGRTPLLEITAAQGVITYSQGAPPSAIWRGRVLMRCGPAFGLDGEPSAGIPQNRVVLDALSAEGLRIEAVARGLLRLRLEQQLAGADGDPQRLRSQRTLAAGPLVSP